MVLFWALLIITLTDYRCCHTWTEWLHSNEYLIVFTLERCVFISTVILLSSSGTVKDERPVSQRALLPVLLPALPRPHCSQAGLPAPWGHLRLPAGPRDRSSSTGGRRYPQPAGEERGDSGWRRRGCRGEMEAPPDWASRVPVLAERDGHDGGVPHSIQQGEQSRLHVHPLCS